MVSEFTLLRAFIGEMQLSELLRKFLWFLYNRSMPESSNLTGKRDEPAKPHAAVRTETEIDGVFLLSYPQVNYDNGSLTEVFHPEWQELFEDPIGHCYFVTNKTVARQEWYYHEHTTDRYSLISGSMEVALFDPRHESPTKGRQITLNLIGLSLGDGGVHGIRIAPGVWHSFKNSDNCIFMNFKTPPFNRETPDKFRISMPNDLCNFSWIEE